MPSEKQQQQTDVEKNRQQASKGAEGARRQVEEAVQREQEQGYRGTKVDPTPDEAYTLQGRIEGQPTPETDEGAFHEAREAVRGNPFTGASSIEEG